MLHQLFVSGSFSVRPGWCTDSAELWRISPVKTHELLEDRMCMERDTHQVCCRCEERPPEPVRCRAHVPGAGRGEEDQGKARSVPGVGARGAQEATLWSREESLAGRPALPGVLCSASGSPRGGHTDRIVAPAPRSPPCHPCHSHSARTVSLSLSCRIRRVWRPGFTVEGSQALAGGRVQVGEPHPGRVGSPGPPPHPLGTL